MLRNPKLKISTPPRGMIEIEWTWKCNMGIFGILILCETKNYAYIQKSMTGFLLKTCENYCSKRSDFFEKRKKKWAFHYFHLRPHSNISIHFLLKAWRNKQLRFCVIERPCRMCGSGALPVLDDQSSQRWRRSHSIWARAGREVGEGNGAARGGLGSFSLVSWRALTAWRRVGVRKKKCKRTARVGAQGSRRLRWELRTRGELVVLKNFARLNNLPTREYHAHWFAVFMCAHTKYFVWVSEYGMGFALRLLHRRMIMEVCVPIRMYVFRWGVNGCLMKI